MHIPKTPGELSDSLGWMIVQIPDFKLGFGPKIGKDGAFERILRGISAIYPDHGNLKRIKLTSLLEQAREQTDRNELLAAGQTFVSMMKMLRS